MNMKGIHGYEGRLTFFILLISSLCCLIPVALASLDEEVEDETAFAYTEGSGRGPKEWGQLDPHWKLCDTGKLQSPIDLLSAKREVLPNLGKLTKDYKPAPAVVKNRGHDVMVRWKGDAGELTINGSNYKLLQCHWHSPSEHTYNGTRYQLELHLVHANARGELAVIALVYKYGRPDPFLASLLPHLKTMVHEEKSLGIVNPGAIKFGSRKYYRYIGSLTVPPCTEGVIWTVINKLRTVSMEQIEALRDAVHDGLEENVRPTQSWDGKPVFFYTPRMN